MAAEPKPDLSTPDTEPTLAEVAPKSGGGGFRRFMRRLVKTVVILAILGGIGAGAYYLWPQVYDNYVRPVAANSSAIRELSDRVALTESQVADHQAQLGALEERTAALSGLEDEVAATSESLAALDGRVDGVESDLADVRSTVLEHTIKLAAIDRLEQALAATATTESVRTELEIVKATELMSRARLFLYQANYGLAEADLSAARNVLAGVSLGDERQAAIDEAVQRLDRALAALPDRPVAAADDLDIAWQALLGDPSTLVGPAADAQAEPQSEAGTESTAGDN